MSDASLTILTGDCIDLMRGMEAGSVHTCVTSPPYFGLRDYGHKGQIGLEATPDAFVAKLVDVFREVRRVLRDDGTVWLVLGDSYARNPSKGQHKPGASGKQAYIYDRGNGRASVTAATGLPDKQLIGIPWRVAFALQADGWYLRQDIIWHKPSPMPESVKDRCTKAHEYLFLLSKSPRYYFDQEAMKEPCVSSSPAGNKVSATRGRLRGGRWDTHPDPSKSIPEGGRNRRSVWTVRAQPFAGAHFATFPPDLIRPCILAGAPVDGLVLDPFGGAGTTGLVAAQERRRAVLCELNPTYADMARDRIAAAGFSQEAAE